MKDMKSQRAWRLIPRCLNGNCKVFAAVILINSMVSSHAAVHMVSTLADSGPGSLRDWVALSNPGDIIQFAVTGKILLASSINIPITLTVQGPGPAALTLDAGGVDRAFNISGNNVFLSGITISNGLVTGVNGTDGTLFNDGGTGGDAQGGAIYDSASELLISNCWITGNTAIGGRGGHGGSDYPSTLGRNPGNGGTGGYAKGGAIYTVSNVTNYNCTFSYNQAIGGQGGAGGDDLDTVSAPPYTGGTGGSGEDSSGGAIQGYHIASYNCTFSGNAVTGGAGGKGGNSIGVLNPGGNGGTGSPGNEGGGLFTFSCDVFSCTVVSNSAFAGAGGLGGSGVPPGATGASGTASAGGISAYIFAGCINNIGNTILADNYTDTYNTNYLATWTDHGFSFVGSVDYPGCSFSTTTQSGTVAAPIHSVLGPLSQNGGGLPTHAPVYGGLPLIISPVIDQGYSFGLTTDERGAPRPVSLGLPEPSGGDGSDVGAFELGSMGLGMSVVSNIVVLSWPAYYADSSLQSASSLLGPNNWRSVPGAPYIVGNQLVVTNHATNSMMFFRLMTR